ncbi:hypothetical protein QE152_g36059 [Popillia japonica]|uniref:Uncharacterized protein n=1 Tax=Popillia japonica TaxID=7064 RepID=A0AAW1IE88_POPJA
MFFRYFIYFSNRNRIKIFLIEINKIGQYLNVTRSNLNKQIPIFAAWGIFRAAATILAASTSSLRQSLIETGFYLSLYLQLIYSEIFLVKTYLNEVKLLFFDINYKLESSTIIEALNLYKIRRNLSGLIADNDQLFNTSIVPTFLTLFIMLVSAVATVISSAKAVVEKRPIDPVLVGWHVTLCCEIAMIIWFILKIRMDVLAEVS